MNVIPPVIVVQDADLMYVVCEQRLVINGTPVYGSTRLRYEVLSDALRNAEMCSVQALKAEAPKTPVFQ